VKKISSIRDAKIFLASSIAAEAEREKSPLSEIERKMLYFSETGWTLPDMLEVNTEFERSYNNNEYEQKIAALIRKIEARNSTIGGQEKEAWDAAVEKLAEGDHYLLVMLDPFFSSVGKSARPAGDLLRLWLTAFAIVLGLLALMVLSDWLFGHH
jgi:hypothetical protein